VILQIAIMSALTILTVMSNLMIITAIFAKKHKVHCKKGEDKGKVYEETMIG
jgi:hypothetical protein